MSLCRHFGLIRLSVSHAPAVPSYRSTTLCLSTHVAYRRLYNLDLKIKSRNRYELLRDLYINRLKRLCLTMFLVTTRTCYGRKDTTILRPAKRFVGFLSYLHKK